MRAKPATQRRVFKISHARAHQRGKEIERHSSENCAKIRHRTLLLHPSRPPLIRLAVALALREGKMVRHSFSTRRCGICVFVDALRFARVALFSPLALHPSPCPASSPPPRPRLRSRSSRSRRTRRTLSVTRSSGAAAGVSTGLRGGEGGGTARRGAGSSRRHRAHAGGCACAAAAWLLLPRRAPLPRRARPPLVSRAPLPPAPRPAPRSRPHRLLCAPAHGDPGQEQVRVAALPPGGAHHQPHGHLPDRAQVRQGAGRRAPPGWCRACRRQPPLLRLRPRPPAPACPPPLPAARLTATACCRRRTRRSCRATG